MCNDISSTREKQEDEGKDKQQNEGVVSASSSPAMTSSTSISSSEKSNLSVLSEQHILEIANEAITDTFELDEDSMKEEEHHKERHSKRRRIGIDDDSTELSSEHVENILNDTSDFVQNNSEIAEIFSVEAFDSETFITKLKTKVTDTEGGFNWREFGYACTAMYNAVPAKVSFFKQLLDNEMEEVENEHNEMEEVENEQNLPATDLLTQIRSAAMQRWLHVTEIEALLNHNNLILDISYTLPASPPTSGQLFLYDRRVTRIYKADGHQWVLKKNSNRVREDHCKLRVEGKFRVDVGYVHSSTNRFFHRRSYHLLDAEKGTALYPGVSKFYNGSLTPSLVLVHYLDTYQANLISRNTGEIPNLINRSAVTIPTFPSESVAIQSRTASTTTTGANGTPIPIRPRPASTSTTTPIPIRHRPASTGTATLHDIGNRGSASVSSGTSNASGNDIWTIDELVILDDALKTTNEYFYPNPVARCEAIADIVGSRDCLQVHQCYDQAMQYGGIEPYIVHLYGRDRIQNGITKEGISDNDVIFGQGVNLFHSNHNGMVQFLHHIREIGKEEILTRTIAQRVVFTILGKNGRFLVKRKFLGDPMELYYPLNDIESTIKQTMKRVKCVVEKDILYQTFQNHIADMESTFPAPPEGRPDLEDMIEDYTNDPNDKKVVEIIKENMYVAVLNQFGMNQYTNVCTFCPISPDHMEKVNDTEGEECIKPFLAMNQNTRGMGHVGHIQYEQIVLQNDERGSIDLRASGIRANDSHIYSWWHPSFIECGKHGIETAVKRGIIPADISGARVFMHFKFKCNQTQQMIQAAQHFPALKKFQLSNDIIIVDFVLRLTIGGQTGIVHPNTIVDCIRINQKECEIRIRGA